MNSLQPLVSVVLSVYNGSRYLRDSLESVLCQQGLEYEIIAIDDGSTDESGQILADYAVRDSRLRVFRQANAGLTRALIRGCEEARGTYIARHDADDLSLPGRLKLQAEHLAASRSVALLGCWTRYIGPEEEELFLWKREDGPEEATRRLRASRLADLRGLGGHGSAMFRREDYIRVGGYRAEFYFAQDLDLWLRLTELGHLAFVREYLYAWRITPFSLTGKHRNQQLKTTRLILEGARLRALGTSEAGPLARAARIRPEFLENDNPHRTEADGCYFVGKCLMDRGDARCLNYLRRSVRLRPLQIRARIALLRWRLSTATTRRLGRENS
jgi:glycosyltransferase involved in cell wall biosynthesis